MELIEPFLNALLEVFKKQLNIPLQAGEVHPNYEFKDTIDIVGLIGISSEKINGELALCFNKASFLTIYNTMFSENQKELNCEITDSAAEFVNMVLGQAKSEINKITGLTVERTTPKVILGEHVSIDRITGPRTVTIPFELPVGMDKQVFYMSLTIDE
ncbi:CheC-like family protein [Bacteriovorax sp. BAL6_X]|uniref:chemotaxis protein CheX n=1 Tax=Bacteriovorax sp. BAL6_X TaxID=1201290 RepID=UPI000386AD01|nr:chemotaxis protein CheX [Bacteriovorax sp. BAL6_X]EPZ49929.1 CheC-like family protein [Bacteriovorax sp. BAL6_X]